MRWLFTVVLCATALAAEPAEDFDKGLRSIRKQAALGRWKTVDKLLDKLLASHKRAAYVLARRGEILDLAKRCAFRLAHDPPDPKDVVGGRLKRWDPKTNRIEIDYTLPNKDWEDVGAFLSHPMFFAGSHVMTLDGRGWPKAGPQVLVCMTQEDDIVVGWGSAEYYGRLVRRRNGETVQRIRLEPRKGLRFPVSVVVKSQAVIAYQGNRKIGTIQKSRSFWGRVAVPKKTRKVSLKGIVEPAWIQGRIDKADTETLKKFERSYDPKKHVPAWLFEKAATVAATERREYPGSMGADEIALITLVLEAVGRGETEAALRRVETSDADPLVRHYLEARLLQRVGDHAEALPLCEKLLEGDPDFAVGRELKGELLCALGRKDEAVALFRALSKDNPHEPTLHVNAVIALMRAGRMAEAETLLRGARARGLASAGLTSVASTLMRARRGPPFDRTYEFKTPHYHVISDIDSRICGEAARLLEQAHAAYVNRLERGDEEKGHRFKVYLLSGQAGYVKYVSDLVGRVSPRSAGVYIPRLKQLIVWNYPQREVMEEVIRHEGFHQYLDSVMFDPPIWFNEGLAVYYENARVVKGQWRLGEVAHGRLRSLTGEKGKLVPLEKFLQLTPRAFMADATTHYAQAWAFIHFLRHTNRENRQLFDRLWNGYREGLPRRVALEKALDDRSLAGLETEFHRHVNGLK